jgi:hypothetical protein
MEIYLVPFSLLDLVILSPVYAYITWSILRRIMRRKRKFTGFLTWSFIIHAAIVPLFWILHFCGAWGFVESEQEHFDPVSIAGHEFGFLLLYTLFCGGLTVTILGVVKRNSA